MISIIVNKRDTICNINCRWVGFFKSILLLYCFKTKQNNILTDDI